LVMWRWQKVCTRKAVSSDSLRLMFDSNAVVEKLCPFVRGLVKRTGCAFSSRSAVGLAIEPGHENLYETLSKSPSVFRQPPILIRVDADPGRQKTSSPCGSGPALSASFVSSPSGRSHVPSASLRTAAQYSKWPISSANVMLPVWAALKLRPAGVAVLYIGW
jgi:hypothetical protein